MSYRIVELAPPDGQRHTKKARRTIWQGDDIPQFRRAINAYYMQPRKPYAELRYYQGKRRIFDYELP